MRGGSADPCGGKDPNSEIPACRQARLLAFGPQDDGIYETDSG